MSLTTLTILALVPLLLILTWLYLPTIMSPATRTPSTLRNKRVILLTAHPDDESMFFAPTLQALTDPSLGNHVKLLCLSNGNASGLGETREQELYAAALTLGMHKREDIFVLNDTRFHDGMTTDWKAEEVAKVLAQAFAPSPSPPPAQIQPQPTANKASKRKSAIPVVEKAAPAKPEGPRATIDVLLTFDSHGISSHPNHIALHSGARLFLQGIMAGHAGHRCPVTLYTLTTVNILRKYTSILDALTTLFLGAWSVILAGPKPGHKKGETEGDRVIFINTMSQYSKAREAMVQGHKSQMVWFRWGWIGCGRYMVVNDLKRELIPGI